MVDEEIREEAVVSRKPVPIPKFQVAIILSIQFSEPITALVIYPFIVQLIRDTGVTGGEESKTGFYAGLLESAFFLAESLTVFHSGRFSDMYGRRPVLLLGPLGLVLSMLGFGLSKQFWTLFLFRCIQGACNGNIGVSKTVLSEIVDPSYIADVLSIMNLLWSVATTICPIMGGTLANAAVKWPATLGKIALLREHPYLLPCGAAALVAFLSLVFAFFGLKETLPSIVARRQKTVTQTETDPLLPVVPPEPYASTPPLRDLLVRPVLIALVNHGLLTFSHMANEALIILFFATPMNLGGLGLKPQDIGMILGVAGFCNAIVQIFVAGRIIRHYGPRRMFTTGFCAFVVQFAMYPLTGYLAQRAGRVDSVVYLALAVQLSCTFLVYFAYSSSMLFIMDAAPGSSSLGSVNGLGQMVGTLLRSAAPSIASSLFSLSAEHHLVGGNMVYIVLVAVALGAVRCSLLLPRTLRSAAKAT